MTCGWDHTVSPATCTIIRSRPRPRMLWLRSARGDHGVMAPGDGARRLRRRRRAFPCVGDSGAYGESNGHLSDRLGGPRSDRHGLPSAQLDESDLLEDGHCLDHWYWGQGQIDRYSFTTAWLTAGKDYGYVPVPLYMLARDGKVIADDPTKLTSPKKRSSEMTNCSPDPVPGSECPRVTLGIGIHAAVCPPSPSRRWWVKDLVDVVRKCGSSSSAFRDPYRVPSLRAGKRG